MTDREIIQSAALAVDNASEHVRAFVAGLIAAGDPTDPYRAGVVASIYRARRTRRARPRQEFTQ
jgi:hypothetical protein